MPSDFAPSHVSFKDTLIGGDNLIPPIDEEIFEDDDIDIVDGDVKRGNVNGLISIHFSDWVIELANKSFDQTIVIKLLGKKISYTALCNRLYNLWKPSQPFRLMDIDNDYFLISLRTHSDYLKVLVDGHWMIFGHYLTFEPWSLEFFTTHPFPRRIVAWILLPNLPVTLYKRSLINEIGECIVPVLKIDYHTENGRRGRFARITINIDQTRHLISKLIVNENIQIVEYEALPIVCFQCGRYNHIKDFCPEN
ncbi:uncharacterized protein LOC120205496 [Hibiscus syriacus]|uniref:uncharacterized protein LOC120205496 n=1 Tax=Hibiscus syriacus TaxID=106335 RepID=UPI001924DD02|nr:uncharacterized protein LOC120205496 [Hibiscus syriacus]